MLEKSFSLDRWITFASFSAAGETVSSVDETVFRQFFHHLSTLSSLYPTEADAAIAFHTAHNVFKWLLWSDADDAIAIRSTIFKPSLPNYSPKSIKITNRCAWPLYRSTYEFVFDEETIDCELLEDQHLFQMYTNEKLYKRLGKQFCQGQLLKLLNSIFIF